MTLRPAPTGYRLAGCIFLPSTQPSPAGLGAPGALGSPAPPDLQLVRESHGGSQATPSFRRAGSPCHPEPLSLSPAGWDRPSPWAQWELTPRGQGGPL